MTKRELDAIVDTLRPEYDKAVAAIEAARQCRWEGGKCLVCNAREPGECARHD